MRRVVTLGLVALSLAGPAAAEPIERSGIFVKDGDTVFVKGREYRLVGFDTPEMSRRPIKCWTEQEKAIRASARLIALLDSGRPIDLTEVQCSCRPGAHGTKRCNNGRLCARLSVGGKDVGESLIAEGLATAFQCAETNCPKMPNWCP